MSTILNLSLAELAICEPSSIGIFEKYQIDYYQKGFRSLKDACVETGLDVMLIYSEFCTEYYVKDMSSAKINYDDMDIEILIDCIETKHHVKESLALSVIHKKIKYIWDNEYHIHPEIVELGFAFGVMMEELKEHAGKEEKVLFPYVKKIAGMRRNKTKSLLQISLITNPLQMLEFEHEQTETELDALRKLTHDFIVPVNASVVYKELMEDLIEFEKGFHHHIHLENNVLFPKIRALEAELLQSVHSNF